MASTPTLERSFAPDSNARGDDIPDFARSGDGRVLPGVSANEAIRLLREAEALRVRAVAHLSVADNHEIAALRGYLSPSRMIAHQISTSKQEADMLARVAKFVARHPVTAQALADGLISLAQADHLTRAGHQLDDEYTRDEQQLIAACATRDPEELARFLAQWRWANDEEAAAKDSERAFTNRSVTIRERLDGSGNANADLDATGLASLVAALETTPDRTDTPDGPRTLAQRRADRLVGICDESLGRTTTTKSSSPADDSAQAPGDDDYCDDDCCDGDMSADADADEEPVARPHGSSSSDADAAVIPATTLSAQSTALLLQLLAGEPVDQPDHGTASEIAAALGLPTLEEMAMGAPSRSTIDVVIDIQTLLGRDHPDIEGIRTTLAGGNPIPTAVWFPVGLGGLYVSRRAAATRALYASRSLGSRAWR